MLVQYWIIVEIPAKFIWVWLSLSFFRKFSIFKLFAVIDTSVNEIEPRKGQKEESIKINLTFILYLFLGSSHNEKYFGTFGLELGKENARNEILGIYLYLFFDIDCYNIQPSNRCSYVRLTAESGVYISTGIKNVG